MSARTPRIVLDPEAPGLDEDTRMRRRSLARLQAMSIEELFAHCVKVGIFLPDGQLAPAYRNDPDDEAD